MLTEINSQDTEIIQVSTDINEEIWKTVVHCIHNEILFSNKKNGISPFMTTWMYLKGTMLRKRSQTEKDKYHTLFSYVLMDTENTWMAARGGWWEMGGIMHTKTLNTAATTQQAVSKC